MGLIRFLLAISVVFTHLGTTFHYSSMDGSVAVTAFYMISGFYMALVLNEKYIGKNKSYKLFIINRFLRIYPLYWFILLIGIICYAFILGSLHGNPLQPFINEYHLLSGFDLITHIFSDAIRVVFLIPNPIYFLPTQITTDPLIIGPSWTLGLELLFYLIAPFIARRNLVTILLLTGFAYVCRAATYHFFVVDDNALVNPAFFPSVVQYFLFGIIAYKIYAAIKNYAIPPAIPKILLFYIAAYTIFYYFVPGDFKKMYYISLLLCIPILFKAFSSNKYDRFLGELSYPIYISHIVLIDVIITLLPGVNRDFLNLTLLFSCVAVGILLYKFIERPVNRYRKSRLAIKPHKNSNGK